MSTSVDRMDVAFRLSPVRFATALGFAPDPWQRQMLLSTRQNMVVVATRQAGKSRNAAIMALHRATFFPNSLILIISPSVRQSALLFHQISTMCRALRAHMNSPPEMVVDNRLSFELRNASRVVALPASPDTIRGFSAVNMLIEDESAYCPDSVFHAVSPMLATTRGKFLLLSTPNGKRGHFYDAWSKGGEAWERVQVMAKDVKRISPEFLEQRRGMMTRELFAEAYECVFTDSTLGVFSEEDVDAMVHDDVSPLVLGSRVENLQAGPAILEPPRKLRSLLQVGQDLGWDQQDIDAEVAEAMREIQKAA